ncbi:hypothetical protein [Tateyamaria sp.]|uniref:hypothetical protein n=1 Tax=Tateyamaria sp. TaxID=1929288 RepID=UPI003B2270FE
MRPAVTVLQLDTHFPRVPGDVASTDSYAAQVEIVRIPAASVGQIVTGNPGAVDIAPFEAALRSARGDVITTSCGFLAHWQTHLAALTDRPVIASALTALPDLDGPVTVLTFDADKLVAGHGAVLAHADEVIGLRPDMHLRRVIEGDLDALDQAVAGREVAALVAHSVPRDTATLLLECTNLPPYKPAIRDVFAGRIVDILTQIERARPGTVKPAFL